MHGEWPPTEPKIRAALFALANKYAAFLGYFQSGMLSLEGNWERSGTLTTLSGTYLNRPNLYFDFEAGDLVQKPPADTMREALLNDQKSILLSDAKVVVTKLPTNDAVTPTTTQPTKRGGRPASYDWDAVVRIQLEIANSPNGLPPVQNELVAKVQEVYAEQISKRAGVAPSDSALKDKFKIWLPESWRQQNSQKPVSGR